MLEWIIISGLVVTMYIVLYRYEKQLNKMKKLLDEHHGKLEEHKEKIGKHHEKLEEHHNYIEEMWVTIPKKKNNEDKE